MVAIGKLPIREFVLTATNGSELEGTRDGEDNAIEVEEQLVIERTSSAVNEGWLRCPSSVVLRVEVEGEEERRKMRFRSVGWATQQ